MGCTETENRQQYLPGNSGNQGELLVMAPNEFWNANESSYLQDSLLLLFPGLPAAEPFFTTVEIKTKSLSDIFKTHRNILEFRMDPTNKTSVVVRKNVYAKQQRMIVVTLNKIGDLKSLVDSQLRQILWEFHEAELERLISRNRAFGDQSLNEKIAESTGLEMVMQQDFAVAKTTSEFMWLRLDREKPVGGFQHQINQGIMIYSRPYTDTAQFSIESLVEWKNSVNQQYVEGPRKSYMNISFKLYPPTYQPVEFRNQQAKEIRGLWRMEGVKGVFMGGPFYGLAFYNPENGRQYMVEGYVYGPQFNKRTFIREIEAIVKSAKPVND